MTKTSELMQNMHELHDKVKSLEQEVEYGHSRSRHRSRTDSPTGNKEISQASYNRRDQFGSTEMTKKDQPPS